MDSTNCTNSTDTTVTASARNVANELVGRWIAMWNGDVGLADTLVSSENRVNAAMFDGGDGSAMSGVSGMRALVGQMRSLMVDLTFTAQVGPIVDGSLIVLRWTAAGHYCGGVPGAGAKVGSPVSFHGTDILRTEHGLVVEYWLNADTFDLMTQLRVGAV